MAKVGKLFVDFEARTATFEEKTKRAGKGLRDFGKDARGAQGTLGRLRGSIGRLTGGFSSMLAPVAGAAGGFAAFAKVLSSTSELQTWRAQLETATGSMEAAGEELTRLQRFALKTPFAVDESINAFVKLKNLGLDPSIAALTSYGNTAAAMGKSLNDMIEAVADAATGEFERLKEFGIKARSEGDKVALTFRGVTTTIGKNAAEIESYLRKIGDVQFAGAMANQAGTLKTAFSNLGAAVSTLSAKFGEDSGLAGSVSKATEAMTNFINELSGVSSRPIEETISALQRVDEKIAEIAASGKSSRGLPSLRQSRRALESELAKTAKAMTSDELKSALAGIESDILAAQARIDKALSDPESRKRKIGNGRSAKANPGFIDIEAERAALEEFKGIRDELAKLAADPVPFKSASNIFAPLGKGVADANNAIEDFFKTAPSKVEGFLAKLGAVKNVAEEIEVPVNRFGNAFADAFGRAVIYGDSLTDAIRRIGQELAAQAIAQQLSQIFGMLGGGGGFLGLIGGIFGGAFADGGNPPVGRVSLVGERGPELFVPKTSGTIIPNRDLARAAYASRGSAAYPSNDRGSSSPIIHQTINIDARGAGPREIDILKRDLPQMIQRSVLPVVANAQRRGRL